MSDDREEIDVLKMHYPIPVAVAGAIGKAVADALEKLGYDSFMRRGGYISIKKRWPANDLPIVDSWFEPMALTDVDERHAAWKDSEGYWWPAWYLPKEGDEWRTITPTDGSDE